MMISSSRIGHERFKYLSEPDGPRTVPIGMLVYAQCRRCRKRQCRGPWRRRRRGRPPPPQSVGQCLITSSSSGHGGRRRVRSPHGATSCSVATYSIVVVATVKEADGSQAHQGRDPRRRRSRCTGGRLSNLTFGRLAKRLGMADRTSCTTPYQADLIAEVVIALGGVCRRPDRAFSKRPPIISVCTRRVAVLARAEADRIFALFFEATPRCAANSHTTPGPHIIESWIDWMTGFLLAP